MSDNRTESEVFGAIGFLNEVMSRHPEAISFAPGAPLLDGLTRDRLMAALDEGALIVDPGGQWERLFSYGPSQGLINESLARSLNATTGTAVEAVDLTVTVGAQEGFLLVLRALELHRGGALGIVAPAFAGIRGAAEFLGVRTMDILEGPTGITAAALDSVCSEAATAGSPLRAVYIAPDYSNPSGVVLSLDTRYELLTCARKHDVLLIEDTTYGFTDPDVPPSLKALDTDRQVIQIGTFSKVCLPGVRVGYVVADQPWRDSTLAAWLAILKNMTTVNTSPLNQAVVAGLVLADPVALRDRGHKLARIYRDKRNLLLAALDDEFPDAQRWGVRWNRPSGGFFVVMDTPREQDHVTVEDSALRHGVLWTPMRDFYAGDEGNCQLRLSCSYAPPGQIREGVRRLGTFLREQPIGVR